MTDAQRIERLEGNLATTQHECKETHENLQRTLTAIEKSLARIEERVGSQKEQLGVGNGTFKDHEERIRGLESIANSWKGWFAGISVGTSAFTAFLIFIGKVILAKLHGL